MLDIYRPVPNIERIITLPARKIEIPQAQVIKGLPVGTSISAEINPGACVLAISREREPLRYSAGHFQAGEIVRELKALAKLSPDGRVAVYHRPAEGYIEELYKAGLLLDPKQVSRVFRRLDCQDDNMY